MKQAFISYLRFFFINFTILSLLLLRSAKKGKDIREQLAEVRPDPDIEDVDRDAAETSRSGELFSLRVFHPSPLFRRLVFA